jgi:hypothetical protein
MASQSYNICVADSYSSRHLSQVGLSTKWVSTPGPVRNVWVQLLPDQWTWPLFKRTGGILHEYVTSALDGVAWSVVPSSGLYCNIATSSRWIPMFSKNVLYPSSGQNLQGQTALPPGKQSTVLRAPEQSGSNGGSRNLVTHPAFSNVMYWLHYFWLCNSSGG